MDEVRPEDIDLLMESRKEEQPSAEYQYIRLTIEEGVATIILNSPKTNYLTPNILEELLKALNFLAFNREARVLVFRAEGEYFCAGLSPDAMNEDTLFMTVDLFHKVVRQLLMINMVTIAVVQGPAYGAGSVLAGMADFVVAAEGAKFGHPEVQYSHFTPTAALLYGRTMAKPRAMYLLLSGDVIDARTAMAWGLVTWALNGEQLGAFTDKLIHRMVQYSDAVLEFGRKALLRSIFGDIDTVLQDLEELYLVQLASTEDAREGIRAWLERRTPVWKHA